MSAARHLLNLPINTDDYALLGVSPRSSRAQIIHAAQGRLNAIAVHSQAESQDAQLARLEIRSAAQRLVAIAAKASKQASNQARPMQFGSIAAAVLMRRNPRRAHMFLAQLKLDEPKISTSQHFNSPKISEPASEIEFQRDPEHVRRAPWLLVTFVSLSLIGLIVEIFVLRAQMQSTALYEESKKVDTSPEPSLAVAPPRVPVTSSKVEEPIVAPIIETSSSNSNTQKGASTKSSTSKINEASRLLRNRWQRAARAAAEIPAESIAPATSSIEDPLEESLRQGILLERMASLDFIARQLEAGDDQSATLLLDTISTESSITIATRTPITAQISLEIDGELSKGLARFPGTSQGRIALLRSFRTRPSAPGRLDAQTLVQEALKGPSRASRTIAQAILVDRGMNSLNVLDAVDERFVELANDPALSGMIYSFSGIDPNGVEGSPAARASIVKQIIVLRGSRVNDLDIASEDFATTLRKIAVYLRIPNPPKEASELLRSINPKYSTRQLRMGGLNDSGVLHVLVQNGTALLRDQASMLKIRRPADHAMIDQVVFDAIIERSLATTALGQAVVNARALLAMDAIQLGVPSLQVQVNHPVSAPRALQWDAAFSPEIIARWQSRLEALTPSNPAEYLNLAEEVADESNDAGSQLLARQLYSLAASMDAGTLATTAALGLAALENDQTIEGRKAIQRWLAIAQRWSKSEISNGADLSRGVDMVGSAVRLGVVEAIVQYRRGYGRRANDRLKKPQVRAFFDSFMQKVPGGVEEFDRLSAIHTNGTPPPLSPETIDALLRVEHGLLKPKSVLWSDAISMGEGEPTFDAPIGSAVEIFGVDPTRNRWTPNGWIQVDGVRADKK